MSDPYQPTLDLDLPLDPSHRWGRRAVLVRVEGNRYRVVAIPICWDCLVDGYEDEATAFRPCRGRP